MNKHGFIQEINIYIYIYMYIHICNIEGLLYIILQYVYIYIVTL